MSPTRAVTLGGALLALSLMGVPYLVSHRVHATPRAGVVVDGRGFGVADAAVYLFSEEHLQLVEETRTDADGDFRLHLEAARPRILVRPPAGSGMLPAWNPPAEATSGPQAFVLQRERALTVRVRDVADLPVAGAEVRVYDAHGEPSALALAATDEGGIALLAAPAEAHVAVFAPAPTPLARWRFDVAVPAEGGELSFTLPSARWLRGHVRDADGPLAGIVITAWEANPENGWNGFARSDAEGVFALPCSTAPAEVRALDPEGNFLPARVQIAGESTAPLELVLERGRPLVVRTTRNGLPIGARVWSWAPEAGAWSWGLRSSAAGRTTHSVSARFGLRGEPFDPALAPLEAWDVPYGPSLFSLEATTVR